MSGVDTEFPVVFAGGGLVGLSTAMFLAQHGVPSLAIERLHRGSQLPRAAFFHMRTLELFRSAGIEEDVRARSLEEFEPEGSISLMDTLAGKVLAGFVPSLNQGVDAFSPCRRLFITQPGLEPILAPARGGYGRESAQRPRGDRLRAGRERRDDDGQECRTRAKSATIRSQYLVGTDGAHSKVREARGDRVRRSRRVFELDHDLLRGAARAAARRQEHQRHLHRQPAPWRLLPARQGSELGLPRRQHRRRHVEARGLESRERRPRGDARRARAERRGCSRPSRDDHRHGAVARDV